MYDCSKMMMSVVTRDTETGEVFVFAKGAPEAVARACGSDARVPSSLPVDYQPMASGHAMQGCYVLALACRRLETGLDAHLMSREDVEKDLSLLGLLLFRNVIRQDSCDALAELKNGAVRTVMITGDNAHTGIYVAKQGGMIGQCRVILGEIKSNVRSQGSSSSSSSSSSSPGPRSSLDSPDAQADSVGWQLLVDSMNTATTAASAELTTADVLSMMRGPDADDVELAVTGAAWNRLCTENNPGVVESLLLRTRIFARVSPEGKEKIVRQHISMGLITGMCGDGGNDCGALRVAHVGVAFSEAEASVVSPFTSKSPGVSHRQYTGGRPVHSGGARDNSV